MEASLRWDGHSVFELSHKVVQIGAGWIAKLRWQRTAGYRHHLSNGGALSPEVVRDQWDSITSFEKGAYHTLLLNKWPGVRLFI